MGGPWQKVDGKWTAVGEPISNKERVNTTANKELDDILKKYSGRFEGKKVKVKKKETKKAEAAVEWVDNSFIKNYTNHEEMVNILDKVQTEYPHIACRYIVGYSVEGRELACLRITEGVREERSLLKPMVKYVANIHGDEGVGRELLLGLARYLTENYGTNPRVTRLVNSVDLHILPSVNPDGNKLNTRENVNDEDLNRCFPGWMDLSLSRCKLIADREKEVESVINWILDNPFVISISFHDGRVMVNYPWDDSPYAVEGEKALCPDDELFSELAVLYAEFHSFMWTGKCLCHSETFNKGISNGAEWYVVDNGMQDFNYLFSNCMEITVELSCDKRPSESHLQAEWENNLEPMLSYIETVDGGVRGLVLDQDGVPIQGARVKVMGIDKDVITTNRGEFWRLLLPGKYTLLAEDSNQLGVLQSDMVEIEVTNQLGKGAINMELIAKICVANRFIVTGMRVGGNRLLDVQYSKEIGDLFSNCILRKVEMYSPECRNVPNEKNSRQIGFLVDVTFNPIPMFKFFDERWGEPIVRRPETEFQNEKLKRRIKMYAEDTWCGRKGDWVVKLAGSVI